MKKDLYRKVLRFGIVPVGFVLASWQLKRHFWKQELLDNLQQAANEEPIELKSSAADYNKRYNLKDISIGSCILVGPKGIKVEGKTQFSDSLICSCKNPLLGSFLVHFGWLPYQKHYTNNIDYLYKLMVIREPDESSGIIIGNDPVNNTWRVKDISQMSHALGTQPVMFRALEPISKELYIKQLDLDNIPNRHMEYVFTWCGLSITALVFSFLL